ncbi:MAG TPA: hypothetical protein VEQ42_09500, partial [Pyrinomonadaceae bacterium]|nr:hypothetical protein [Pyrinomonadaceae bacterium]
EIQDLVRASVGLNLALDYLPGSITFDPLADRPDSLLASQVVWLDAYVTNVDRTPRNTNILVWHRRLWLIDHGAALYFHHAWDGYMTRSLAPFKQIKDHVLLPFADSLREADGELGAKLTPALVEGLVGLIPDAWLGDEPRFASVAEHRAAYVEFLLARAGARPRAFVEEAVNARTSLGGD